MRHALIFLLGLIIFAYTDALGQNANIRFGKISRKDGLSHSSVDHVVQDDQGFLWMSTHDGLNRYDGYKFKIFRHDPHNTKSIHSSVITNLTKDKKGFLWMSFYNGGLNRFDPTTEIFTYYQNDPSDTSSLSNNKVYYIYSASDHDVWMLTARGLNRYNHETNSFKQYLHDSLNVNTLSNNAITTAMEDKQGNLWVGTRSGLNVINIKSGVVKRVEDKQNSFTTSTRGITSILKDSKDYLWIGTDSTLQRSLLPITSYADAERIAFKRIILSGDPLTLDRNKITTLVESAKGDIWIGTHLGLARTKVNKVSAFDYFLEEEHYGNNYRRNKISRIKEDSKGNIWATTDPGKGLFRFEESEERFVQHTHNPLDPNGISSNDITFIFEDRANVLWISTGKGGVNKVNLGSKKFNQYAHSPLDDNTINDNNIFSIYENKTHLYIGTLKGLNKIDRNSNKVTRIEYDAKNVDGIQGKIVGVIEESEEEFLWIGYFDNKISKYFPSTNTFTNYKQAPESPFEFKPWSLRSVLTDSEGTTWFGACTHTLTRLKKGENIFKSYSLSPPNTHLLSENFGWSLLEDKDGNLWIGTSGSGLVKYNKNTDTFKYYLHDPQNKESISGDDIRSMHEDKDGVLWIGFFGSGLNSFNKDSEKFTPYTIEQGLPSNEVQGILEDGHNNLWISTNEGLSKFNKINKTFRNYKADDGIQGNEFHEGAYFKNEKGEMFFGGSNGVTFFHPDSIVDDNIVPPVAITNLTIFNRAVNIGDILDGSVILEKSISSEKQLTLGYNLNDFTFEFAALQYVQPENVQYAYRLQNYDKEWKYTDAEKRFASYTNLSPGKYIFQVKASNSDGVWDEKITAIEINITPPYWQTWWFRSFAFLFIAGSIYSFVMIRFSVVRRQKAALELQIQKQTAEVREQKEAIEAQAEDMQTLNEQLQAQTDFLQTINEALELQKIEITNKSEEAEKARAEAERANQAKSIFLATMSHEIRTPMNGVLGMAALLAETKQTPEQQEYTDTIRSSGDALLTVINDILDFSKIESGNLELDNHSFDLRHCLEEVMDLFSSKAAQKGLDLVYQINYQIPSQIIGDSHRLRQILINLISNAMKFTHQGEIFVGIELLDRNSNSVELVFEVRDTGIGIPADKISRLFKAFSQVDSSTTRKYGGTGLGLIISQRLIELMGGAITVESEVNVGTTFRFNITSEISQENLRQYVHCNTMGNEGRRALVVDDNATNLAILKNQLELWKLQPMLASSAKQALDILEKDNAFDVVITDMQMPEMDGVQLSREIKVNHPALPIILLSSVGEESKKKFPELFSSVLNKPVKQNQLCRVIQFALRPNGSAIAPIEQKTKQVLSEEFARQFPLRILLAEDNLVNQKLTVRVLNKLGYPTIDIAQNGVEAIEKLEQQFYEVILMDMQMPEMDGLEATRRIRLMQNTQPVIIAMTANAMQGDRDACINAGMNDYVTKPINLDELVNALKKASASFTS